MKLNKILRNFFIVFIGFLMTLNLMASPALASTPIPLEDFGSFEVYANDESGVAVFDPSLHYGEYGDYFFDAEGVWQGGSATPECDWCGDPNWESQYQMLYPEYDSFSLIVDCSSGLNYEDCRTPEIPLFEDEKCVFKMNDAPGGYGDNTGFVTVHYQRMN
ncbi:hypothetical protein [Moorena sp. SIO3A5]|uniref:hypothetical protein n=1 Tax=Moorena sp. SIO3A5 TaxID=2607822 RepID=UPI00141C457D|nr:hypothetical protein [Moorena sp. SIO3A5]NEP63968.1 hypothetical protein [Moorena sp. SIO3A5]